MEMGSAHLHFTTNKFYKKKIYKKCLNSTHVFIEIAASFTIAELK